MKAALAVLVLLAYFAQSEAVRCWTCDKESILDCNIIDDQRECDGKCMKTTVGSWVTRSCVSHCPEVSVGGQGAFCCDWFLCNAAPTMSSFTGFIVVSVLVAIYNRM